MYNTNSGSDNMRPIDSLTKPPKIKVEQPDLSEQPYYIKDFIEQMKGKDLSLFYNNLKTLKIIKVDENQMSKKNASAEYDVVTNTIRYIVDDIREVITHELIHMATRYDAGDIVMVGFLQVTKDGYGIGEGLCEAYTAQEDYKNFSGYAPEDKLNKRTIYLTSRYLLSMFEILIGIEHFNELFYEANMYKLFEKLSLYSSQKRAWTALEHLDAIFHYGDSKNIPNIPMVLHHYSEIMMFLSECFITKMKLLEKDGKLTKEEYMKYEGFIHYLMRQRLVYFKVIKSRKIDKYYSTLEKLVDKKLERRENKNRS